MIKKQDYLYAAYMNRITNNDTQRKWKMEMDILCKENKK